MHIHLTPLIICFAFIALAALANIITLLVIGGGSKWPHSVDSVTEPSIAESIKLGGPGCDCPCHHRKKAMFPGMRCVDCMNELCDEGTVVAEELEN